MSYVAYSCIGTADYKSALIFVECVCISNVLVLLTCVYRSLNSSAADIDKVTVLNGDRLFVCSEYSDCAYVIEVKYRGDSAYTYRKLGLFTLERDYKVVNYYDSEKNVLEDYIDADGNLTAESRSERII